MNVITLFFLSLLSSAVVFAQAPTGGGGIDPSAFSDEMTPLMREHINAELESNAAALKRQGKLLPLPSDAVSMQWPLKGTLIRDAGYHGISNWVDLDATYPNHLLDWNCGARTYDQAGGYNHAGIDIFLYPFSWILMDQQAVDIVAAAPGTIIGKTDGNDDRSCPNNYSADWNAVYVQHSDGTVAWYGHMKRFSQTSKSIGTTVAQGEFLGNVGSSGFSTGPHLHFEVHTGAAYPYTVRDPFSGACQALPSLWAVQPPYYDSKINKLATHSAAPNTNAGCPNPGEETPNFKNAFQPGDTLIVAAYYHDQRNTSATQYTILRPDHSVYSTFSHTSNAVYYAGSYWYWNLSSLPLSAPSGVWIFRAVYEGQTSEHRFTVGDVLFADSMESG